METFIFNSFYLGGISSWDILSSNHFILAPRFQDKMLEDKSFEYKSFEDKSCKDKSFQDKSFKEKSCQDKMFWR